MLTIRILTRRNWIKSCSRMLFKEAKLVEQLTQLLVFTGSKKKRKKKKKSHLESEMNYGNVSNNMYQVFAEHLGAQQYL